MSGQITQQKWKFMIENGFVSKETHEYFCRYQKGFHQNWAGKEFKCSLKTYPLISVIIPTYNRLGMLKKAVQSVINQKYPTIEIIVINDCSSDGTFEYLESLKQQISNLVIIHNTSNLNAGKNRQLGYLQSSGKYIVFLDDDDFYTDVNFFRKVAFSFEENDDLSFVAANSLIQKQNELFISENRVFGRISNVEYLNKFQSEIQKPNSTFSAVFDKHKLESAEFSSMTMMNDVAIYLRALLTGDAYLIRDVCGVYLIHGQNISFSIKPDFLIQNMQEKLWVYNQTEKWGICLRYDWLKRHFRNSLKYFILSSKPSVNQIIVVYRWIWNNTKSYRILMLLSILKYTLIRLKGELSS